MLTLGAHAQRGLLCVSVCLSVCVFVCYRSSSYSVRFNRHLRHYYRLFGFSTKPSVRKLWHEKANELDLREPFSRSFGTNETQQLREGQLVGRIQRLVTGATGVKQARYRQDLPRHSYGHAQYTLVAVHNAWCNTCIQCLHMNSAEGFAL